MILYPPLVSAGGINHASGMPPYKQCAKVLRDRIAAGVYTGRLPSERTLAEEFAVAVNTVRKALAMLRDEGLIETAHGWGSSVIQPLSGI
jgi:DNA-binding GntR family transcriptional regulator